MAPRAVLDTNIFIAYLLSAGDTLSRLIEHWRRESFICVTSPQIIAELEEVLASLRLQSKMVIAPQALLNILIEDCEIVKGTVSPSGVCRDPKDDIFLACAVEAHADYLVSGDRDLLDIGQYGETQIVTPAEFLALLDSLTGISGNLPEADIRPLAPL